MSMAKTKRSRGRPRLPEGQKKEIVKRTYSLSPEAADVIRECHERCREHFQPSFVIHETNVIEMWASYFKKMMADPDFSPRIFSPDSE